MTAGPGAYAALSGVVFALGVFGLITRSSTWGVLMAIVVMLCAPVIALLGFSQGGSGPTATGGALALFAVFAIVAVAATGAGLALLVQRRAGSSDVDDLVELED